MKKIATLLIVLFVAFACNNDNNIEVTSSSDADVTFNFTHIWDETLITSSNLENETVTNANGEVINMDRIRYLVSRFELVNTSGESFAFEGYKFTDLSDEASYNFVPELNTIATGTYTLKFIWGFNETDNIDGAYGDLNIANWSWPAAIGGGYHFMQFDGMYNVDTTNPSPFNFHNGTARVNDGVFEQNFAVIELETPIQISGDAVIEVKMDIAEFFKNPNTWDLNVLDTPLMPNYDAQKMMQQNVTSVFSIGEISE